MSALTAERLRELLDYDPTTGNFRWRKNMSGGARKGSIAGTPTNNGYWQIGCDGTRYMAHRLAFIYMTGEWPVDATDHKDRCRTNNRWSNLRQVTNAQNAQNTGARSDSKSGHRGVYWMTSRRKWQVQIQLGGARIALGYYVNLSDAITARLVAEQRLFTHSPNQVAA